MSSVLAGRAKILPSEPISPATIVYTNNNQTLIAIGLDTPLDYTMLVLMVIFFLVGAPINLTLSFRVFEKFKILTPGDLLKFQLLISYLLLLFVYMISRILWRIAHDWNAGTAMCKIVQFGQEFSFLSISATLAFMALDRALCVARPFTPKAQMNKRAHCFIVMAWLYSTACSIPQLVLYTVVNQGSEKKPQCVSVWSFYEQTPIVNFYQAIQNAFYMITVFWLPVVVMVVCYVAIAKHLWRSYDVQPPRVPQLAVTRPTDHGGTSETTPVKFKRKPENGEDDEIIFVKANQESGDTPDKPESPVGHLIPRSLHREAARSQRRQKRRASQTLLTMKSTLLLLTAYFIGWFPYHSAAGWFVLNVSPSLDVDTKRDVIQVCELLLVTGCVVNPFLYGFLHIEVCSCFKARAAAPSLSSSSSDFAKPDNIGVRRSTL